ncbi:Protein kinase domain-containing protein [Forsythia ovata]|uniref:Protein kinase domain-containing protein n=1 Tax=Forsythia ovata TaxID=205694 RepID=A0ABD1VFR7_9LAMI
MAVSMVAMVVVAVVAVVVAMVALVAKSMMLMGRVSVIDERRVIMMMVGEMMSSLIVGTWSSPSLKTITKVEALKITSLAFPIEIELYMSAVTGKTHKCHRSKVTMLGRVSVMDRRSVSTMTMCRRISMMMRRVSVMDKRSTSMRTMIRSIGMLVMRRVSMMDTRCVSMRTVIRSIGMMVMMRVSLMDKRSMSMRTMLRNIDMMVMRSLQPRGLAETLCSSPLYMAPEIIQLQKYDAKDAQMTKEQGDHVGEGKHNGQKERKHDDHPQEH